MKKSRFLRGMSSFYSVLVFTFMYAPIVVLIVFSFNKLKSRGKWGGFTFDWYRSLFDNEMVMSSLYYTLTIALIASAVAIVVGTLAAIGIFFMNKRWRRVHMNVAYLPVLNADIVTGISLLLAFSVLGISLGYVSLLLAHITFNIPYVILSVLPKLQQMEWNTYEAAQDLGAPPVKAFFKAVIPEIMPGVVTGFLLAFTLSIDDFVISYFTAGPGVSTLSVTIYSMARKGIKPEINALSTIMFVVVLALLLIINFRNSNADQKKIKAIKKYESEREE
jgi:spermidine/putrescine transport system permease protein